MTDCIFCKIVEKKIPARMVYEDQDLIAFHDISPVAPVHVLLVPKKHIATLDDARPGDLALLGKIQLKAAELARELGVAAKGYRVLTNCRADAGQVVFHLHVHLIGGRGLGPMVGK